MFELIDLHTRDFDARADVDPAVGDPSYVGTARIPRMTPRPEILVWGSRSFLRTDAATTKGRPVYVEGFAHAILHTVSKDTVLE